MPQRGSDRNCTNSNLFCTGNPAVDGAGSGCPTGIDVIDNVVGYLAINPNAQYISGGLSVRLPMSAATCCSSIATNDLDLTALKRFNLTERFKVEFRGLGDQRS